ncbi:uncharacterized protein LOC135149328 [Daucus carota subsp. sativus]|uniref:uncharacterized protein LOC135149328 n=1 Tax=Daucus carota subsp. sativus TaxID=79200 RepID=UPI0030830A25
MLRLHCGNALALTLAGLFNSISSLKSSGYRRMASRLSWRRMPRRVTLRWLVRRNRTHTTTPDYSSLPDEVIEQILLKLKCIKSIVTCTSVCKSWYVLIKSRRFVTMHLSRPHSNAEYFLCSYFRPFCYSIQNYNSKGLENYYEIDFPETKRITVHGSGNGLICYTKFDDVCSNIYLWNPTIRKLKILPKSRFYHTKRDAYGFWYDTISDDCKVAIISCTKVSNVEVYSLSSNLWNIITTSGPSYLTTEFFDMVHVNGTLYWLTSANRANWSDERKDWKLTSLTLKNGMFRETLIWPVERSNSVSFASTLGACSDSIFVLRVGCDRTSLHVYDESLNELHRNEFEKSGKEVCRVLGVRSNGIEVLFQKFGTDPPILVFDVGELKLKEFCPSAKTICRAIPFVETLVLLDDGDSRSIPKAG